MRSGLPGDRPAVSVGFRSGAFRDALLVFCLGVLAGLGMRELRSTAVAAGPGPEVSQSRQLNEMSQTLQNVERMSQDIRISVDNLRRDVRRVLDIMPMPTEEGAARSIVVATASPTPLTPAPMSTLIPTETPTQRSGLFNRPTRTPTPTMTPLPTDTPEPSPTPIPRNLVPRAGG